MFETGGYLNGGGQQSRCPPACRFPFTISGARGCSVYFFEHILSSTAYRTHPFRREFHEGYSGFDAAIRITQRRIVDVAADAAPIFDHDHATHSLSISLMDRP